MAKEILVVFDRIGNTLDVWFGEPREAICEEVEEEFLIRKRFNPKTGFFGEERGFCEVKIFLSW